MDAVVEDIESPMWSIRSQRKGSEAIPLRKGFTCRKYFTATSSGFLSQRLFEWYAVKDKSPLDIGLPKLVPHRAVQRFEEKARNQKSTRLKPGEIIS